MKLKRSNKSLNDALKHAISKFERFNAFYNKFINHRKKTHRLFIEKDMRI
jgi:hypothetical protein